MERIDDVKIIAYLHRVSKDHDGEVTLTLKCPSSYKNIAMNLPEKVNFEVTFEAYDG
jgi:hypothetical protein